MFRFLRARKKRPPVDDRIEVHLVEWPSMREQGVYYIMRDTNACTLYAYGVTKHVDHYLDAAREYRKPEMTDDHATSRTGEVCQP